MLNQMQNRFQSMSDNIIGRIDEMGGRIDELEKSIADLVQEAQSEAGADN
jgi:heat shock factor-binding protein 1